MKYDKITFLYLKYGKGRATAAILPHNDNIAEMGIALCSPTDKFVKKIGRELAVKRLINKKDFYINYEMNDYKLKNQASDIINFVMAEKWVTVLDFDTEINTTVYEIITETNEEYQSELGPITIHTNVIPHWASDAAAKLPWHRESYTQ